MLIFYCSSRRFLLATWTQQKMGRGFLEIFANNPSIFPLENEEISYSFFTEIGNYLSTKKLFEVDFFERNKRVFFKALLSGAWVCKNSLGEALAKKKKENIGMWVSKQWWIFFKRQRQQQACFAHRTQEWERPCLYCSRKKIYRVDRNCATATLLIRAKADLH